MELSLQCLLRKTVQEGEIMALIPPFFLNTVVAIGVGDDPNERHWIGTGFLLGRFLDELPDNKKRYQILLITNKHVLINLKVAYIKFNSAQDPKSKDYKIPLISRNGRPIWIGHPSITVDVAAMLLNPAFLKAEGSIFEYFRSDEHILNKEKMIANGITEGDPIFVLGFPIGLVAKERQYVICRAGCLARVRDFLENRTNEFLIDAPVFPGNSGNPVILCPASVAIQGTSNIGNANLIGMVKSYVPYKDIAISQQTQQARIIFEENSGLAAVESVDSIIETVELVIKRVKNRDDQKKRRVKERLEKVISEQSNQR